MKTIVLLSCAKTKGKKQTQAQHLYTSSLFTKSLNYAKSMQPDAIYILSAKHHLLKLQDQVKPYNLSLNDLNREERRKWSKKLILQLAPLCDFEEDSFIFLAGTKYRQDLVPYFKHVKIPMQGLGLGEQLQFLTQASKTSP